MITATEQKIRATIIAGARSTEHEVSLLSAYNIVNAINKDIYDVSVVGIDKQGVWKQYDPTNFVTDPTDITDIALAEPISGRLGVTQSSNAFYDLDNGGAIILETDVIFPAVLGNYAEDGTMQGLLRMMDVPFTTPDVLGSSVAMDKDVASRLLRDAGINVANFITIRQSQERPSYSQLTHSLGSDILFVKPANAGSSVGVSRVTDAEELRDALALAFRYDVKVLVQAGVIGREVEISVMGNFNEGQKASMIGEIIEKQPDDFYSYENKYVNSGNVDLIAPALLDDEITDEIQATALDVCRVLECEGFSRVDFFVDKNNEVYVNEVNTMPGFTKISMFPRLWSESGVDYPTLVDNLLQYALKRHTYRIAPMITDARDVIANIEVDK